VHPRGADRGARRDLRRPPRRLGAEACALLDAYPIAGIILDVRLGEEHGLDLIPRFRARSPAPILVLTGHSSEDLAIQAVDAQVAKYLKKPLDLHELRRATHASFPRWTEFPRSPRAGAPLR